MIVWSAIQQCLMLLQSCICQSVFISHHQPCQSQWTSVCSIPSLQTQVSSSQCPWPQHSSSGQFFIVHFGQLIFFSVAPSFSCGVLRYCPVSLISVLTSTAWSSDMLLDCKMAALQLASKRCTASAVDCSTFSVNYITQHQTSILWLYRTYSLSLHDNRLTCMLSQMILIPLHSMAQLRGQLPRAQHAMVCKITLPKIFHNYFDKDKVSLTNLVNKPRLHIDLSGLLK